MVAPKMSHQVPDDDASLHLPRILCLHGGGTNARIFKLQCRVLSRALQSTFRLVYAQAPFAAQPGLDVTSVYQKMSPFTAWLPYATVDTNNSMPAANQRSLETPSFDAVARIDAALAAAMRADDGRGATGPWVGLLGFSQGAKIAASLLHRAERQHHHQHQRHTTQANWHFAVLLAGRGPLVDLAAKDVQKRGGDRVSSREWGIGQELVIRRPTVHVHGMRDPNLMLHRAMMERHCEASKVLLVEWEGEHRVPIKSRDVETVVLGIWAVAREAGVLDMVD